MTPRSAIVLTALGAFAVGAFAGTFLLGSAAAPEGPRTGAQLARPGDAPSGAASPIEAGVARPIVATADEAGSDRPAAGAPADGSSRRGVNADEARAMSDSELAAAVGDDPVHARLADLLRSGAIDSYFATDPDRATRFLIDTYIQIEEPLAALEVLELADDHTAENWGRVADALRKDELDAEAAGAYERALAELEVVRVDARPANQWISQLTEIDPARAAAILADARPSEELGGSARQHDLAYARALGESGQTAAALAVLERMLQSSAGDPLEAQLQELGYLGYGWGGETADGDYAVLDLMMKVDPGRAEQHLLARLADGEDVGARTRLIKLLSEGGRVEEAREQLLAGLEGEGRQQVMRAALQGGDERLLDGMVEGWAEQARGDGQLLGEIGEYHLRTGDREAALTTYTSLYDEAVEGRMAWLPGVPDELIEAEPQFVRAEMDRLRDFAGTRDELWGDMGDTYWELGLRDEARSCWERALEIDPTDGEWIGNVRALRAGRDPR